MVIAWSELLAKGGAIAVALAGAAALGLAPAAAAPKGSIVTSLSTGGVRFRADGHSWVLQVNAAGGATVTVSIATPHLGGFEVHSWVFRNVPGRDFTVNQATGAATLDTGRALSPVVSLALRFSPLSRRKAACTSGSGTDFTGTVTGTVSLVTGLRRISVHLRHAAFSKPNLLDLSRNCVAPQPCGGGVWTIGTGTPVAASGSTASPYGPEPFPVTVTRPVKLTRPNGAIRSDDATIMTSKPVFSSSARSLTVRASRSGIVTGQTVLSHARVIEPIPVTCVLRGKTQTEIFNEYLATSYASPARQSVTAHTILTGPITVPAGGIGTFVIVTKAP